MSILAEMEIEVDLGSNVQDMIDYMDILEGRWFEESIRREFEESRNMSALEKKVKGIVKRLIYDRWEPESYIRTNNLLESFVVSSGNNDGDAGLVVYSDPDIAEAKLPSGPDQSYAVFFERPEEYQTFIHPRGQGEEPRNYRPFFSDLYVTTKEHTETTGSKAISKSLRELRPISVRRM
jgi:hypothetical protein